MAKKQRNNAQNRLGKSDSNKGRSLVAILVAIFGLLLVWFIIWLYDWWQETFGSFFGIKPKNVAGSLIQNTGYGNDNVKYTTINNTEYVEIDPNGQSQDYYHTQDFASTEWHIQHDFQRQPHIQTFDSNGSRIYGVENHYKEERSDNEGNNYMAYTYTKVIFSEAESGTAVATASSFTPNNN